VIRFVVNVFLVLWLGLLTAATIESHRDVDWTGVKGLGVPAPGKEGGKEAMPDLLTRMEQASWRRSAPMEVGEGEVNRYLARVVAGNQRGPTASTAQFERVALDFEPGVCRVIFAWKVAGRMSESAAVEFTVKRDGENFVVEPQGGMYGRLPVHRGMMCALTPALGSLCGALDEEISKVFQMNQIRFEKDKVLLDPRPGMGK
jgi:hypothetical protein